MNSQNGLMKTTKANLFHLQEALNYITLRHFFTFWNENIQLMKLMKKYLYLRIASDIGHLPIVQYLIEKDANIESKDREELASLDYTSCDCKSDIGFIKKVKKMLEGKMNV